MKFDEGRSDVRETVVKKKHSREKERSTQLGYPEK
jgi:hypothetical protein